MTYQKKACLLIPKMNSICETVTRKFIVKDMSKSCLKNYLREICKIALYFNRNPLDITTFQLEEYLYFLKTEKKSSESTYKHVIYGLNHLFMMYDMSVLRKSLPTIIKTKSLPIVFSKEEVHRILSAPKSLKNRLILGITYDCGLRRSELANLAITDVDMDRKMVHIRKSKNRKDRYVPISDMAIRGLQQYIKNARPQNYLFNGKTKGGPISAEATRNVLKQALLKSGIDKKGSLHTLRHSYATHLLESGLNIVTIKDQMGHSNIQTTLIYLQIAQISSSMGYSPLTVLYGNR